MYKYRLPSGTLMSVSEENLQAFLAKYGDDAVLESGPTEPEQTSVSTPTIQQYKTSSGALYNVSTNNLDFFKKKYGDDVVLVSDDVSKKKKSKIQHISDEDFMEAADDPGFLGVTYNQEDKVLKKLKQHYNTDLGISEDKLKFEINNFDFADSIKVTKADGTHRWFSIGTEWFGGVEGETGSETIDAIYHIREWIDAEDEFIIPKNEEDANFGEDDDDIAQFTEQDIKDIVGTEGNLNSEEYVQRELHNILHEVSGKGYSYTVVETGFLKNAITIHNTATGGVRSFRLNSEDVANDIIEFLKTNPKGRHASKEYIEQSNDLKQYLDDEIFSDLDFITKLTDKKSLEALNIADDMGEVKNYVRALLDHKGWWKTFWGTGEDVDPELAARFSDLTSNDINEIIGQAFDDAIANERNKRYAEGSTKFVKLIEDKGVYYGDKYVNTVTGFMDIFRNKRVETFVGHEREIATRVNELYHTNVSEDRSKELIDEIAFYVKRLEEDGNEYHTLLDWTTSERVRDYDGKKLERIDGVDISTFVSDYENTLTQELANVDHQNQREILGEKYNSTALALSNHKVELSEKGYFLVNLGTANQLKEDGYITEIRKAKGPLSMGIDSWVIYVDKKHMLGSRKNVTPGTLDGWDGTEVSDWVSEARILQERSIDLNSKMQALDRMYLLNESISSWDAYSVGETFLSTMVGGIIDPGLNPFVDNYEQRYRWINGDTKRQSINTAVELYTDLGWELDKDEAQNIKVSLGEELSETAGGLPVMLGQFFLLNKAQGFLLAGTTLGKFLQAAKLGKYASKIKGKPRMTMNAMEQAAAKSKISVQQWAINNGYATGKSGKDIIWHSGKVGSYVNSIPNRTLAMIVNSQFEGLKMNMIMDGGYATGVGFSLAGSIIPWGKFVNPRLEAFSKYAVKNPTNFALGSEFGHLMDGLYKDMMGQEEFADFVNHHYADYDANGRRLIVNLITGAGLGLTHASKYDFMSKQKFVDLQKLSKTKWQRAQSRVIKKFEKENPHLKEKDYTKKEKEELLNKLNNDAKYTEHYNVWQLTTGRLNAINGAEDYGNPALAVEKLRNDYKGYENAVKERGETAEFKPIWNTKRKNKTQTKWEEMNRNDVEASFEFNPKTKKHTVWVNMEYAKQGLIPHEVGHGAMTTLWGAKPRIKMEFLNKLLKLSKKIDIGAGEFQQYFTKKGKLASTIKLYDALALKYGLLEFTPDARTKSGKRVKFTPATYEMVGKVHVLEAELFAHLVTELSKKTNIDALRKSHAFDKLGRFLSKEHRNQIGKAPDLRIEGDVVRWFSEYAHTVGKGPKGDPISKMKQLESFIVPESIAKKHEESAASETVIRESRKLVDRNKILFEKNWDKSKRVWINKEAEKEFEENKKALLESKDIIDKAKADVEVKLTEKEAALSYRIDKNFLKEDGTPKYTTKEEFKQAKVIKGEIRTPYEKTVQEIKQSNALDGMIMEGVKDKIKPSEMSEFVENVKARAGEKFMAEYDPGRINKEYGRALTPYEWLTTGHKSQTSILWHARGDVMKEFKTRPKTDSYDAPGFTSEMFENYSTESDINYTRSDLKHTTRDLRERLDLKNEKGKSILDKKITNPKGIEKTIKEHIDDFAKKIPDEVVLERGIAGLKDAVVLTGGKISKGSEYTSIPKWVADAIFGKGKESVQTIGINIKSLNKNGLNEGGMTHTGKLGVSEGKKVEGYSSMVSKSLKTVNIAPKGKGEILKDVFYEKGKTVYISKKTGRVTSEIDPNGVGNQLQSRIKMSDAEMLKQLCIKAKKPIEEIFDEATGDIKRVKGEKIFEENYTLIEEYAAIPGANSFKNLQRNVVETRRQQFKNEVGRRLIQESKIRTTKDPNVKKLLETIELLNNQINSNSSIKLNSAKFGELNLKDQIEIGREIQQDVFRMMFLENVKDKSVKNPFGSTLKDYFNLYRTEDFKVSDDVLMEVGREFGKKMNITERDFKKVQVRVGKEILLSDDMNTTRNLFGFESFGKGKEIKNLGDLYSYERMLKAQSFETGHGKWSEDGKWIAGGLMEYITLHPKGGKGAYEAIFLSGSSAGGGFGRYATVKDAKADVNPGTLRHAWWRSASENIAKGEAAKEGFPEHDVYFHLDKVYKRLEKEGFEVKDFDMERKDSDRQGTREAYLKDIEFTKDSKKIDVEKVEKNNEYAERNNKIFDLGVEFLKKRYEEEKVDHLTATMIIETWFGQMKSPGKKMAPITIVPWRISPEQFFKEYVTNKGRDKDGNIIDAPPVLEHATTANVMKNITYRYVLGEGSSRLPKEFRNLIKQNYKQYLKDYTAAILPKSLDNLVNTKYKQSLPDYFIPGKHKPILLRTLEGEFAADLILSFRDVKNKITYDPKPGRTFNESKKIEQALEYFNSSLYPKNLKYKTPGTIKRNSEKLGDFNNIDKALAEARKGRKDRKGISVWDFDDTLAYTKGGVRYTLPNPSGKPQPKKKVIFMAGGPGSGKSNVIRQLGLEKQGFKIVNQDISLEWLMKNHGMPRDMREFSKEQRTQFGKLSHEARQIAVNKKIKYQGKGDGVVVDGTGASLKVMEKNIKEFTDKGYDVQMVFVETSLEVSQARNLARPERSLRTGIVVKTWESVQGNKEVYKKMFGERFAEVNTDNLKQGDKMPSELTKNINAFTGGYIKGRLNAGEFADRGGILKEQGAEFDFAEFDVVTEGRKGPLFELAMERVNKFGNKHNYILTARPEGAQAAIHEFLKSQGLDIPIENIKTLGNSTAEAKALWMIERAAEGYNDFYFADDAIQNVKAVRDVLERLDVRSKVVQAKIQEKRSLNNIRDVEGLSSSEVYNSVRFSKKHRSEYEKTIAKHRPDLVKEKLVSKTVDEMFEFVDGLDVPANKKKKYQQITTKWLATSNIKLKEDAYKVKDAIDIAERHKEDIFSYRNPNEIIEKYAGKVKEKPINPNTVKEFSKGRVVNKKHGITEHEVSNTKEGQQAVRNIINTHWGKKSNPWCLTQAKEGKLTDDAWVNWRGYEDGPKSIVFQNGKLIAFKANGRYWDRMDSATDAPVIKVKDGRVTKTVELVPMGKGKVQEFVMETRTVSKDKKTVTTEIFGETGDYLPGTKIVENRVKGQTVKETQYRPNGKKYRETKFKDGKAIEIRTFMNDGRTMSINDGRQLDLSIKNHGDLITHEIRDGKTDYWFGVTLLKGKDVEIGFKTPTGFELMDVMKRVDGKLRVDFNKLRKIDPDIKGLPKEVVKPQVEGKTRNLKPVKDVLDQLDVKSSTQQEIIYNSAKLGTEFNKIIEDVTGVKKLKVFEGAEARMVGGKGGIKGRNWSIIVPGAQDFQGLLQAFMGKGKEGLAHQKFWEKNLIRPFARGFEDINTAAETTTNDYKSLRRQFPKVVKQLSEKVGGTSFTLEQAIRIHRWTEAGYEIPDISKKDVKKLNDVINKNIEYKVFSDKLSKLTKLKEGYVKPGQHWEAEVILSDIERITGIEGRKKYLAEWIENKNEIFSEENLNKIEATQGSRFRDALEDVLYRMETGRNRPTGHNAAVNQWMNFINGYVGCKMFFNVRSATLQLISTTNYINWAENNPAAAAKAFANIPQFRKDFLHIWNSPMLRQRRKGLKINVQEAEFAEAMKGKSADNWFIAASKFLLRKGFTPTQIADSIAISAGGATYLRNRIKMYEKTMSTKKAEKKAWLDFQETTQKAQQSARPDLISKQQAGPLGRTILAWANTPMQYMRIQEKMARDIINGRYEGVVGENSLTEKVSKISYYGVLQSIIFTAMQGAVAAVFLDEEDDITEEMQHDKNWRMVNSILDSQLRGIGIPGSIVAAAKNSILQFHNQEKKGWRADHARTVFELAGVSPPIGGKLKQLYGALQTYKYNREVIPEMGLDIQNPAVTAAANVIEVFTNIPTGRANQKMINLREAADDRNQYWQRMFSFMGYSPWDIGVEIEEVEEVKERLKKEKKEKKSQIKTEEKSEEKQIEEKELENKFEKNQQEEIDDGKKNITCSAVVNGKRCKIKVKGKGKKCTIHEEVKENKWGSTVQCRKMKTNGERCKITTKAQSGYCYYHD